MYKPHNYQKIEYRSIDGRKFYITPHERYNGLISFGLITGFTAIVAVWGYLNKELPPSITVEAVEQVKTVTITPTPTSTTTIEIKNIQRVTEKQRPSGDVQSYVVSLINEIWGKDAEIGKKIAFCESSWGLNLTNSQSSATGVFQIIKATWISNRKSMGADTNLDLRLDHRENIKTAYYLYQKRGTQPWDASKWCWSK